MLITLNHAASSHGIPVILDDSGAVMDYAIGIRSIREKLGVNQAQLGARIGVSARTVAGWEQGRMPETAALNALAKLVNSADGMLG